jgi:tetratricopeptide (TPR) repeat protein
MKNTQQRHQPGRSAFSGTFRTCLTVLATGAAVASAGDRQDSSALNLTTAAPSAMTDTGSAAVSQYRVPIAHRIESYLAKHPAESLVTETFGSQRIMIELEESPKAAAAYAKKYDELVSSLSTVLGRTSKTHMSEDSFLLDAWVQMSFGMFLDCGTLPRTRFLSESLRIGTFDCQCSSVLVFDIAKEHGINVSLIVVPGHVLLRTKNFFLETTSGDCRNMRYIREKYPFIEDTAAGPGKFLSEAYNNRGLAYDDKGDYRRAIDSYSKAIGRDSACVEAFYNRGSDYYRLGKFRQALENYTRASHLYPNDKQICFWRARAYQQLELQKK